MNNKYIFREKAKPNCCKQNRTANKDINDRKITEEINTSFDIFCPFSKSKKHMQTSQLNKELSKKKFICEDCTTMLNKYAVAEDENVGYNLQLDKKKLDSDYIDSLVYKIKELKNRVKFFENHYGFESMVHNSVVWQYHNENETIGDYEIPRHHKYLKDKCDIKFSSDDMHMYDNGKSFYPQFCKPSKNISERQRSIYTNNDAMIASSLIQDAYPKISKNQKNKSNASIVMSLHSTNHNNDFLKVHPHMNSKHFQAAAEDFIEQAEELKSKIGYILECCGYNTPTISNLSDSRMPSEINSNTINNTNQNSHSTESMNDVFSDPHLKVLFETVSSQYREILDSLVSIESQIKTLHKYKTYSKFAEFQEEPHSFASRICERNRRMEKNYKSTLLPNKKGLPPSVVTAYNMETKSYLPNPDAKHLKMGVSSKLLEPVVMVYEPIRPEMHERERPKTSFNERRNDFKQKYGFVVTYTPDISPESGPSISDNKVKQNSTAMSKKQVKKKKLLPCLGF